MPKHEYRVTTKYLKWSNKVAYEGDVVSDLPADTISDALDQGWIVPAHDLAPSHEDDDLLDDLNVEDEEDED